MKSTPNKRLNAQCPFCDGTLAIHRLTCGHCDTAIESNLEIPSYFRLPPELQEFVLTFLRCRGNIREVEKALSISYPTVCKRLDMTNELLGNTDTETPAPESARQSRKDRMDILKRVEEGEITAKDAVLLLKEP